MVGATAATTSATARGAACAFFLRLREGLDMAWQHKPVQAYPDGSARAGQT